MSKSEDQTGAFHDLREYVSPEDREALAREVEEIDLGSYEAVAKTGRKIIAALLRGNMPPGIAREVRSYLELEMLALAAEHQHLNGSGSSGASLLVQVIDDARRLSKIEPTYSTVEGDALRASGEVINVPVKVGGRG